MSHTAPHEDVWDNSDSMIDECPNLVVSSLDVLKDMEVSHDTLPSISVTHVEDHSQSGSTSGLISSRRSATNRPVPNLRVDIPPSSVGSVSLLREDSSTSITPGSAQVSSGSTTAAFLSFVNRKNRLSRSNTPVTPIDQIITSPLDPPGTPRTISLNRNGLCGRWLPTPTEGVLPVLSPIISSPTQGSGFPGNPFDSLNTVDLRSPVTRRRRLTIAERRLSGLSLRNIASSAMYPVTTLGSPFGVDNPSSHFN